MIKVYQTIIGDNGDCFAASLASLLELTLEEVPKFQDMGDKWFPALWDFLISRGYIYVGSGRKEDVLNYDKGVDGYYIVKGKSPRGYRKGHAVVYHCGKLAHDPHPSGLGVLEVEGFFKIEREKRHN